MAKFKVGDRVISKGWSGLNMCGPGRIGTVMENSSSPWCMMDDEVKGQGSLDYLGIPENRGACFGEEKLDAYHDPIKTTGEWTGLTADQKQAVKDFALRFIESHNPANAQEIAAAAIQFTGGDDV